MITEFLIQLRVNVIYNNSTKNVKVEIISLISNKNIRPEHLGNIITQNTSKDKIFPFIISHHV